MTYDVHTQQEFDAAFATAEPRDTIAMYAGHFSVPSPLRLDEHPTLCIAGKGVNVKGVPAG